jgi:cytochrome c
MDSWEFNKIAGAALAALLLAFGSGTLINIASEEAAEAKPGYVMPVDNSAGGASEGAAPAAAFDAKAVVAAVGKASADNGQALFKPCAACHTVDKSGKAGAAGPNLYGVVGRPLASSATFPRYSAALKAKGGNWTYEALAQWLHDPKAYVPGNQMSYAGIKNAGDEADVIAYLRSQADSPAALPQ